VRGRRASIAKTEVDLVLVSARYKPAGRMLLFARGYARRGPVWMDIKLYDRTSILEALEQAGIDEGPPIPVGEQVARPGHRAGGAVEGECGHRLPHGWAHPRARSTARRQPPTSRRRRALSMLAVNSRARRQFALMSRVSFQKPVASPAR